MNIEFEIEIAEIKERNKYYNALQIKGQNKDIYEEVNNNDLILIRNNLYRELLKVNENLNKLQNLKVEVSKLRDHLIQEKALINRTLSNRISDLSEFQGNVKNGK